jgi:hypothetical protein
LGSAGLEATLPALTVKGATALPPLLLKVMVYVVATAPELFPPGSEVFPVVPEEVDPQETSMNKESRLGINATFLTEFMRFSFRSS